MSILEFLRARGGGGVKILVSPVVGCEYFLESPIACMYNKVSPVKA